MNLLLLLSIGGFFAFIVIVTAAALPVVLLMDNFSNTKRSAFAKFGWTIIILTIPLAVFFYGFFLSTKKWAKVLTVCCLVSSVMFIAWGLYANKKGKEKLLITLKEVDQKLYYSVKNPEFSIQMKNDMRQKILILKKQIRESDLLFIPLAQVEITDSLEEILKDNRVIPEEYLFWKDLFSNLNSK